MPSMYEGGRVLGPAEVAAWGAVPPGPVLNPADPATPMDARTPVTNAEDIHQNLLQRIERAIPSGIVGPTVGGLAGGVLGVGAGGIGSVPGAVAGAGLGGMAEENLRQMVRGEARPGKVLLEGAKGAGQQLAGEAVGAGAKVALNSLRYSRYATETASSLVDAIKQKVPEWASYPEGVKGLVKMMGMQGQKDLSSAFDASLTALVGKAQGKSLQVPADTLFKLGLLEKSTYDKVATQINPQALMPTPADEVVKAVVGKWTDPKLYSQVLGILDNAGLTDPAARAAYKWGTGIRSFANATKMLEGETFHPERAQAGLMTIKKQGMLGKRDMGDVADILRGTGDLPVSVRNVSPWEKFRLGAAAGSTVGTALGHGAGASGAGGIGGFGLGGLMGEALLPNQFYRNVPPVGMETGLLRTGTVALGDIGRLFMESLNKPATPTTP